MATQLAAALQKIKGVVDVRDGINPAGETHLKLVGREQRCVALAGRVGEKVGCTVYALRPMPCRDLAAGSVECLERRREKQQPIAPGAWKAARARSTRWGE